MCQSARPHTATIPWHSHDVGLFARRGVRVAAGAAAVAVLVFAAASWMESLRTGLHLEAATYELGETVPFALRVCSESFLPMRSEDGKPSWQITNEMGDVVADSSHQVFRLELKTLTWSPRQCREVLSVEWDQRKWNRRTFEANEPAGVPRRGEQLGPGRYELRATWGDLEPVRATFQIVA